VHAAGVSGAAVRGPYGAAAVGRAGAVGVGPYGGVAAGGYRGVATGPYGGYAAAGYRGVAAARPYSGYAAAGYRGGVAVGGYGGVGVARAGAVAVGHTTGYLSPVGMRTSAAYVRSGFRSTCFTPGWYGVHRTAWVAPRWRVANFWAAPAWTTLAGWCGLAATPLMYDYGSNVVIDGSNQVYMGGEPVATAEQYAEQAATFADLGRQAQPAAEAEWQPLGVFGMIQPEDKTANQIFQLAIDQNGVIRGNYYDAVADNTLPVYGSVDRTTQRAAWSIGDKKNVVFEAGLNNLTQEQCTLLVHYGNERTQQLVLVRLEQPGEGKQ
jgi:hypothetical protein